MLASSSRRALVLTKRMHHNKSPVLQMRLVSSLPSSSNSNDKKERRRELHSTARRQADATEAAAAAPPVAQVKTTSSLADRFVITAEVTISKIFPAGFGWQSASVVADNLGYAADSMPFALTTGFGDAVGVLGGHMAYYSAKKAITGSNINLSKELQTGVLLGSAAFCSGTVWQPLVNALQAANLPFNQVFFGTWVGCGAAFYVGLRVGRTLLSGPMQHIEEPTYENGKADMALSTAIGGATGFFVGTDAAYLPHENFLIGAVGIQDGTPDLVGAAIAGSSTSLGFLTAQSTMNMVYPTGKCWND